MKNKKKYWFIGIFILFCNIPIVSSNIKFFFEGNLYDFDHYITKDKKFATGSIRIFDTTNTNNRYYWIYRQTYPNADSTLYRIKPMLFYRFWRWAEYIYDPHWWQPYMKMSIDEHYLIFKGMYKNREKYGTPFPKDTVNVSKK